MKYLIYIFESLKIFHHLRMFPFKSLAPIVYNPILNPPDFSCFLLFTLTCHTLFVDGYLSIRNHKLKAVNLAHG